MTVAAAAAAAAAAAPAADADGDPTTGAGRRPARRRWLVVGLAAVVALAVVAAAVLRPEPTGLTRTRHAAEQDSRWVNGITAGATLVTASRWLLEDAKACQRHRGPAHPGCRARLSAAAWASVTGFAVDTCTAPGVYRARTSLLRYVDAIVAFDRMKLGTAPMPAVPDVPRC